MIGYKPGVDVFAMLREKGFTTYVLKRDKIISQKALQKIRNGRLPSWHELDILCRLIGCTIGDIIEYIPNKE